MKNKYLEKMSDFYKEKVKPAVLNILNKPAVLRTGKRKITYYPFKILGAILCFIVCISLIASVFSAFAGHKDIDVSFEYGTVYKAMNIGNDILIYNNKNVKAVNDKGKTLWQINETLSEPLSDVGGKYYLLMDLAGNHYAKSFKNGKIVNEYAIDNDIISGKITKKGYAAFATDTDGYKGKVSLYNKRGREIYVWNSGSGYITDIDITDNGRYLAVAQLLTEESVVNGRVQIIDTGRGEVISSIERSGEAVVEVKYNSADSLIVVTDNCIAEYNKRGKEKFSISLDGKDAKYYDIDSDKLIGINVMDNRGNSVLELYNMSGKLKGTYVATGDIHAFSIQGKRAVVVEQRGVVRVNGRGKEREVCNIDHDVKDIGYFANGKKALIIGASNAEIISVK